MTKKRYWLRGGVASVIVFLLLLILIILTDDGAGYLPGYILPIYPGLIVLYLLINAISADLLPLVNLPPSFGLFVGGVVSALLFFIIGALIGWVYGKFKNE